MITVEAEVPMMGSTYDFQIDENTALLEVMREMADLICRKERCKLKGNEEELILLIPNGFVAGPEKTAAEYGLQTGAHLTIL